MKKGILKSKPSMESTSSVKVQLDAKTVITLRHKSSLKIWQQRYPDAKVIST